MRNSEIMAIPNQYKETVNDFIDSSDPESPDWAGLIDKRSHNATVSEGNLADFLEGNCLDKEVLDRLSWLMPKTEDS